MPNDVCTMPCQFCLNFFRKFMQKLKFKGYTLISETSIDRTTLQKNCLLGRTWSSAVVDGDHPARIFGPPWPIRKLFFFVFEALYSHGLGQNVADGRPARGRWWFLASGSEVNAILCFDEHGAQMSATLAIFFFLGRAPVWTSPVELFMILDHGSQTSASQNEKTLNSWILFHPWFLATRL